MGFMDFRKDALTDYVEVDGTTYLVDSCNTPDAGYETMAFELDASGEVVDWASPAVTLHYLTKAEMVKCHAILVQDLAFYLEPEVG